MELDELLEDLSRELREPVSIDDRRLRLLAYSTHEQSVDPVREHSIMARSASAPVVEWLQAQGIANAEGPVPVAANLTLGLAARVCVPLRRNSLLLGYLWVVVGERTLDPPQLTALERYAPQAAELVWQRRFESDLRRAKATSALTELLAGESSRIRSTAARELRDALGFGERDRVSVVFCDCSSEPAADVGDKLRRQRRAPTVSSGAATGSDRLVVLAALGAGEEPRRLAESAVAAGADRACASRAFTELTAAGDELAEAQDGLVAAAASGGGQRATTVEELGSGPLIVRLWNASGRPATPVELAALLGVRGGAQLAQTTLAVLDGTGELAEIAAALHLHRATLYRRVARVEALTGLRLSVGDERLRLHLALRMWRLGLSRDSA